MTNKLLLGCGIAGAPLFIVSSLVQAALRDGFDLRRHHLSSLALGDFGWVQTATFAVTGLLMLAFAAGLWPAFRAGAVCFGVYGIAMMLGAVFPDQPAFGFPPGMTADGDATMHAVGAIGSFIAEVGGCFVFAVHFLRRGRKGIGMYSIASGLAAAYLVVTMDPTQSSSAPRLVATCLVTGAWMTAVAVDAWRGSGSAVATAQEAVARA
ncbi:MAG: DUF998 domain-containing protein [Hamadaea sp.]|nr:DUF998 domain-containing protein [Hamadaea sp.]